MKKRAIITGVTGQDGSYLADLLATKDYEVYGMVRRSSTENFERINHLMGRIELVRGDLLDQMSLIRLIQTVKPHEVYNLAAQSFVPTSFEQPTLTGEFTAQGVARILEAIRLVDKKIRFYQASSSEMFGLVAETPQSETTPLRPRNPYGVAKTYGHWMTVIYREGYHMFACSGILFNHESPRRGKEFVSRRISVGVAKIKLGLEKKLTLGNLKAKRDWGFAGDYVEAMWKMLQQPKPDDYVVATGEAHTVEDFARVAFNHVGLNWKKYVETDQKLVRPTELHILCGNALKARRVLGWKPKMRFEELVYLMVDEDIKVLANG
ncbi:MAG: GDP-mannose 4,6-dehydratase [Omnitrophica bacterium RIFCSPLOWO2_12_FULL_44_17]|uniref:GDP-mannose 4,6-dehydratase n=1 Tax=Candidatus Danuiimicrobium aquiferis TaxID=1801832 RepID=A0A1G1KTV2_9BACT|nr:MAG: GDP-mannose 4,6-dehydratase [Omnitrophica bacterium RIFCSPHIGHO2_02_FULL_45_28]OGW90191.1 MAG: GDP-mannose 4,6-dehydratase [Omnitrophica bacterium RIFCSPHIGHO2_12_FULL_44_12]OGW96351.1 MAG: GDP-mannose 4,6-dehydratase [Omnitrophica bacterium RIFCSPLOWO2_12_FULL_44_17]OGX04840.1 MAG: GDP-mannose 4,6-dehydratase [Omnitrophica bacterium RIFCSPLOWO2_02_FULL_44_11]